MQKALEPLGVSLIEATNGVEALNIIKSGDHDIDAILIDIEMPRMDELPFDSVDQNIGVLVVYFQFIQYD